MLIRAATGFAIAWCLLNAPAIQAGLRDNAAIRTVKADISAARPDDRLRASVDRVFAAHNGTSIANLRTLLRAHALHS